MRGKKTMSNKQLLSFLEALKIIVNNASDRKKIKKAIEQLQDKLKEKKIASAANKLTEALTERGKAVHLPPPRLHYK